MIDMEYMLTELEQVAATLGILETAVSYSEDDGISLKETERVLYMLSEKQNKVVD